MCLIRNISTFESQILTFINQNFVDDESKNKLIRLFVLEGFDIEAVIPTTDIEFDKFYDSAFKIRDKINDTELKRDFLFKLQMLAYSRTPEEDGDYSL